MKIVVTKKELQSILSSHFRVNVTEVEMLDNSGDLLGLMEAKVGIPLIGKPSEKINAIKTLRQLSADNLPLFGYGLGLAEAKFAVENWATMIQFIKDNGRFPKSGFCNGVLS